MFRFPLGESADLRLLEIRHAVDLFACIDENRSRLRPWLNWVDETTSASDTETFIRTALGQFSEGKGFHAGIFVENKPAGGVGYHEIDWANRKTSIGYWIAASQERRGLVTAAVRALVNHAFTDLGLNRLEIRCALDNQRSRAVPIRVGFCEEGIRRQYEQSNGAFRDLVVYCVLATEWSRRTPE